MSYGGFPYHRFFGYSLYNEGNEEAETESIISYYLQRYGAPAQAVPSCATGDAQGDQATQSSEQAMDTNSAGAQASTSQGAVAAFTSSQATESTASQSTTSVTDTAGSQSPSVNTILADQLASTTVTASTSGQSQKASDLNQSTSSQSVIVTDILDPASQPSSSSPSVSAADIDPSGVSQASSPQVIVSDLPERHPSGASPKRKASESDEAGGEPAPKEAKREDEDREDVDELLKLFHKGRRRPLSPERAQQFRLMSRDVVEDIRTELLFRDAERGQRRYRRGRHGEMAYEPQSDEDSEEERLVNQNPRIPVPQAQAKFPVTEEQQLLRLLILGSVSKAKGQRVDPKQNSDFEVIKRMIANGSGTQVVETLKDVSVKGRSSKQDSLVYGLALCCRSDNMDTKRAAYAAVQAMCRTPTQIFQLINYIETMGKGTGWGRGLRRTLSAWYNSYADNPMRLAMHVTKYWNRHGWNHRDVFRLCHIKPDDETIGFIIRYAVKDMSEAEKHYLEDGYLSREQMEKVHKYLKAVEEAKQTLDVQRAIELIHQHGLVREQLRTELLNEPDIWKVMLPGMPLMALTRNLGKMSLLNLFDDPERVKIVVSKLTNVTAMKKARIHPFKLLLAHHIYKKGSGERGSLQWTPNPKIVAALEKGFYQSFETVVPTNKRILIALDISGSMGSFLLDSPIEIREAATLMAMVTVKREPNCDIVGFHNRLIPLDMFKRGNQSLSRLVESTHRLGFGTTDCSKPMTWARKHRKEYDAFIVYTDSETNSHRIPPYVALDKYRETMNIPNAKLIVVGMVASDFSIARPDDLHMLDVVGFDPDTPDMIREFLAGGLE